jgi:hypothetical protein
MQDGHDDFRPIVAQDAHSVLECHRIDSGGIAEQKSLPNL